MRLTLAIISERQARKARSLSVLSSALLFSLFFSLSLYQPTSLAVDMQVLSVRVHIHSLNFHKRTGEKKRKRKREKERPGCQITVLKILITRSPPAVQVLHSAADQCNCGSQARPYTQTVAT